MFCYVTLRYTICVLSLKNEVDYVLMKGENMLSSYEESLCFILSNILVQWVGYHFLFFENAHALFERIYDIIP